jgi:hypothetical protein
VSTAAILALIALLAAAGLIGVVWIVCDIVFHIVSKGEYL